MFDFLRARFTGGNPSRSKSEQARPGVQLLASVLVCFPERFLLQRWSVFPPFSPKVLKHTI